MTSVHPPFCSWSRVKTFPQQASHAKKLALDGDPGFQMTPVRKGS